jgi:hypothetical protein
MAANYRMKAAAAAAMIGKTKRIKPTPVEEEKDMFADDFPGMSQAWTTPPNSKAVDKKQDDSDSSVLESPPVVGNQEHYMELQREYRRKLALKKYRRTHKKNDLKRKLFSPIELESILDIDHYVGGNQKLQHKKYKMPNPDLSLFGLSDEETDAMRTELFELFEKVGGFKVTMKPGQHPKIVIEKEGTRK